MPEYDNLPEAMRHARRWLLWKSVSTEPGKKARKVPFYASGAPRNGALDTPADTSQLVSFPEALAALTPAYTGLGFALGPDGPGHWQGIDLDDLASHPELQALAPELPGYTELSPSGKGVHAIGYGRPFAALGANGSGVEAYSAGRYFTVTAEGSGLGEPVCLANFINEHLRGLHSRAPGPATAEVTEFVPARTIAELRSALLSMRADDRDLWVANGQRLKRLGEQGRALWLEWSATSDKFDAADASRVWDSLSGSSTGYAAVFAAAQAKGWVNPLSSVAGTAPALAASPLTLPPLTPEDITAARKVHPHAFLSDDERGLFPEGEVTVIASPGREGKSTMVMAVAVHYALGLPLANMVPAECRPVLIYSGEDDRAQYARKAGAQLARLPSADQPRVLEHLLIPDLHSEGAAAWRELVRLENRSPVRGPAVQALVEAIQQCPSPPGLIIFETASTLSEAEEDNPGHKAIIAALKHIAKATRTAVILVHHTSQAAAQHLPTLDVSEADIRGGTTLVNNARQTHLVVNLGSLRDPHPDGDARTLLRALVAPGVPERVTMLVCLSSSKCADPAPLFFRWEDSPWGPRMVAHAVPGELKGKSWRGIKAQLAGARAEARAEKKAEAGKLAMYQSVRAAAELAEKGEQPTARQVSIACGRSFTWAKPYLEAAVEMGLLVRSTEPVPRSKGLQDVFRPVPEGKPWDQTPD